MSQDATPVQRGVIGQLFWAMPDPAIIIGPEGVSLLNEAAVTKFGISQEEATDPKFDVTRLFGSSTEHFWHLIGTGRRGELDCRETLGAVFSVVPVRVNVEGLTFTTAILRDETAEARQLKSLKHLNEIAREVLAGDSVDRVLQQIADDAKQLTGSDFSALLILKDGSTTEIERFVYNAPRELFPDRLPRAVGLLAVPIETQASARLDDIRGHPRGVGIPVEHPPIGPLLAVPILVRESVIGEVAVANKAEGRTFDEVDEAVLNELGLHAAQALDQAASRELAKELQDERQALFDMVRHDIATPVATAKGAIQLLRTAMNHMTQEQLDTLLQALSRSIAGIERLATNLSVDVRLEREILSEEFTEIDVHSLLDDLDQDLESLGEQKNLTVSFSLEPDAPRSFVGGRLLVRQAVENLVTNAIKYSPNGSLVAVTVRGEGDSIRFDVRDQGPGIPVEEQSTLFDRFRRGASTTQKAPGLGLGLSIVKRVATSHGGTAGVASRPGEGSTFWISFPVENWRPAG